MLSDALLQEGYGTGRLAQLELELPLDKVIKFVSVGLPLLLVSMAFAREVSLGEHTAFYYYCDDDDDYYYGDDDDDYYYYYYQGLNPVP